MITLILVIVLVLILFGGYRTYPNWPTGYGPLGLLLIVLLVLILVGGIGYIQY